MQAPEEHDELEAMLGGLPMREPSQILDARIAATLRQLSSPAIPSASRPWLLKSLALAALVLIASAVTIAMLLPVRDEPEHTADPDRVNPELLVQRPDESAVPSPGAIVKTAYRPEPLHLTWTRDLGEQTRYTPKGLPYRAIIRDAVEQRTWYEPDTGVTRQISVPRQELIVVKQTTF